MKKKKKEIWFEAYDMSDFKMKKIKTYLANPKDCFALPKKVSESFAEFLKEESFSRITCVRCSFPNLKADKLLLVKDLGKRNLGIAIKIKKRLSASDFPDAFVSVRDIAERDFERRKRVAVACLGEAEVKKQLEAKK